MMHKQLSYDGVYLTDTQMWDKKNFCPFRDGIEGTTDRTCRLTKYFCCYWCFESNICKNRKCPGDGVVSTQNCREEV